MHARERCSGNFDRHASEVMPVKKCVPFSTSMFALMMTLSLSLLGAACSTPGSRSGISDGLIRVDLDKRDSERLMRFYMGAVDGVAGDSLLTDVDGALHVRADRLSDFTAVTLDTNDDDVVDWEELTAFVRATYNENGRIPATLDRLRELTSYDDTTKSLVFEVIGTMSVATRRVFVPRAAVIEALEGFSVGAREIHYPIGTTIVGEHWLEGRMAEVTAMRKRADGFWDFFVYDEAGALADSTTTEPRPLEAPIQCAGCHFGTRTFEPEKSFPASAPDGPDGPRVVKSATPGVTAALVAYFDEHRRRSDTVLGIYATVYIGSLIDLEQRGMLDLEGRRLLESTGAANLEP